MYCANCGTQMPEGAAACPGCGHPAPGQIPADLASFGSRVAASIVDVLILLVVYVVLIFGAQQASSNALRALGSLIGLALLFLYKPLMEGSSGQTVGKKIKGIVVVRAEGGGPIGYGSAFVRALVASSIGVFPPAFLVDVLWSLWDPRRQALRDKAAGTIVVRVAERPV